ncbi:MAG: DNA-3-methyladenine glycosylase [Bacteroidota bacterium]
MLPDPRIQATFFRQDVLTIAPRLLGMKIVRILPDGERLEALITETEAYRGEEDLACHASKGRTPRTQVMYSAGGILYVYLIYGMHWLMNIVTGNPEEPQAVLIRGISTCNGPGRVTKSLQIDRSFNGESLLTSPRIWLEPGNSSTDFLSAPRVGIDYAGDYWKNVPWRYIAVQPA